MTQKAQYFLCDLQPLNPSPPPLPSNPRNTFATAPPPILKTFLPPTGGFNGRYWRPAAQMLHQIHIHGQRRRQKISAGQHSSTNFLKLEKFLLPPVSPHNVEMKNIFCLFVFFFKYRSLARLFDVPSNIHPIHWRRRFNHESGTGGRDKKRTCREKSPAGNALGRSDRQTDL